MWNERIQGAKRNVEVYLFYTLLLVSLLLSNKYIKAPPSSTLSILGLGWDFLNTCIDS